MSNDDDMFGLDLLVGEPVLVKVGLDLGREDEEPALLRGRHDLGHPGAEDGVADLGSNRIGVRKVKSLMAQFLLVSSKSFSKVPEYSKGKTEF